MKPPVKKNEVFKTLIYLNKRKSIAIDSEYQHSLMLDLPSDGRVVTPSYLSKIKLQGLSPQRSSTEMLKQT